MISSLERPLEGNTIASTIANVHAVRREKESVMEDHCLTYFSFIYPPALFALERSNEHQKLNSPLL